MGHEEALDALHVAAVEPGGLDRLMAGDTPEAAAFVGHLAGCDLCPTELERLRRSVPLLRDVVRTTPPADLRERTLAFVAERGVPRGAAAATAATGVAGPVAVAPIPGAVADTPSRRPNILPWVATIAAAVLLSVVATSLIVGNRVDDQLAQQERTISALEKVTTSTLAITGEEDAERVALLSTDGSMTEGTLVYSPSTTELVVTATGLTEPSAGQEYRCWVLVDGERQPVGKMFFADDLAFWVGETPAIAGHAEGMTFGVSLAEVGSSSLDADPVMVGEI
jgi:hypothetical protein